MKKIIFLLLTISFLFSFDNKKIENLMGADKFQTYNKLLSKIFTKDEYSIYEILAKLKDNGLLELFFDKAKIIHTNFVFEGGENILNTKILRDTLSSLGYYYFYPSEIKKDGNKFILNIEFKSEHFIDPVSLINEMNTRGCNILDVSRKNDIFNYEILCKNVKIKEAKLLEAKNKRYINANGTYWLLNDGFSKINIKTKRIDYWHPSVWFYDKKLNLLNNVKRNKKVSNIILDIPAGCKYIKIIDMYNGENFKRGIIVKGLK